MFRLAYVVCLCLECNLWQFSMMRSQFVNASRGCKRRPYGGIILQSRFHDCLVGSHECLLCLPHPVGVSVFIICRSVCTCTEML